MRMADLKRNTKTMRYTKSSRSICQGGTWTQNIHGEEGEESVRNFGVKTFFSGDTSGVKEKHKKVYLILELI